MKALQFFRAIPDDASLLAELNRQLIEDEGHRNPMALFQLEARMRHWLENEYQAIIFRQGENPVAYALYRQEQGSIYLRQFFVDRNHRRQGIGRQAMALLFSRVWPPNSRITVEVLVTNEVGHMFWKAMGFQHYAITLERMPDGAS